MKSTLREARARLSGLAPGLNPEMYARLNSEVEEAAKAARSRAEKFYSDQLGKVDTTRHELLVEACEVRDAYEALRDEAELGRLSAGEYGGRLNALNARRDRVESRIADVDQELDRLEAIEDDPEAWTDEQYRKYPTTAPTFSF